MKITVGIPTHNEEAIISECIHSVFNQKGIKPFEVIVVASGCTDNTVKEIQKCLDLYPNLRLILEKERRGKISALNIILSEATGDIIFHTDGDVIIDNWSLLRVNHHFKNEKIAAVSGRVHVVKTSPSIFYRWAKNSEEILMMKKLKESSQGIFFHLCGYAMAHRKGIITKIPNVKGATDATMGEIIAKKGKVIFDRNLKARVIYPRNITDFINQKARIRYGFLKLNEKRPSKRTMSSEIKEIVTYFKISSFLDKLVLPFMLLIYLASWLKAYNLYNSDADLLSIWKPINSTKKL